MRATSDPISSYRASRRPRTVALLLAVGINLLILIMLLTLAPRLLPPPPPEASPPVFDITPDPPESQSAGDPEVAKPGGGATARSRPKDAVTAPPPPPSAPPAPQPTPNMLVLSREDFAASDIGSIRSARGEEVADSGASSEGGDGADSGSAYGPGDGPGGERLYRAEWYRRPTDRELGAYMPPQGAPAGGWAEIACRTVADNRVEDCRELGDYPRGSRLAGAIRQAAWQFRVRPPRIGGKPVVGAWVRIHIDFTERPQR
jgi:protein TonB